ncbi:MAG: hypothetical protein WCO00_15440 [Rhodospirillaceae bacterium]
MLIDFFLKSGKLASAGDAPPFLLEFQVDAAKLEKTRGPALKLLAAIDANVRGGISFENDTERAVYLIGDSVTKNTHLQKAVQKAMSAVIVFLATDTDERREDVASGKYARIGFVVTLGDIWSAETADWNSATHGGTAAGPMMAGGKRYRVRRVLVPA